MDFPHPEILPQLTDFRGKTKRHREINYVQGLGRVLGSSVHLKPSFADEFWYLHGRDAHQFYKRKTNPLNIPYVAQHKGIYESFLESAMTSLPEKRFLHL